MGGKDVKGNGKPTPPQSFSGQEVLQKHIAQKGEAGSAHVTAITVNMTNLIYSICAFAVNID